MKAAVDKTKKQKQKGSKKKIVSRMTGMKTADTTGGSTNLSLMTRTAALKSETERGGEIQREKRRDREREGRREEEREGGLSK